MKKIILIAFLVVGCYSVSFSQVAAAERLNDVKPLNEFPTSNQFEKKSIENNNLDFLVDKPNVVLDRPMRDPGGDPDENNPIPVGSGLAILSFLGAAYLGITKKKK